MDHIVDTWTRIIKTVTAVFYVVGQDAFSDRAAAPKGSFLRDIETSFTVGLLV